MFAATDPSRQGRARFGGTGQVVSSYRLARPWLGQERYVCPTRFLGSGTCTSKSLPTLPDFSILPGMSPLTAVKTRIHLSNYFTNEHINALLMYSNYMFIR